MQNLFIGLIKWLKSFSFLRFKVTMFSVLVLGVMTNLYVKIDIRNSNFEYNNNGSSSFEVVIAIIITCLVLIGYNFMLEKVRSTERTNKEILSIIKNPEVSELAKKGLIEMLKTKY